MSTPERARVSDLMALLPKSGTSVLDVGARDGFISRLLAGHFPIVTALDLELPSIDHERVQCVKGNIAALDFPDASFDLVFCAEVLEHIPIDLLGTACRELARVSKEYVLIGVPYKQDIRVGRTTCGYCGKVNPPWGHVNTFTDVQLSRLFPAFSLVKESFVGQTKSRTNALSSALMDIAGNPYGTYSQDEPCVHCGKILTDPPERTFLQKVATKAAFFGVRTQSLLVRPQPNWIHRLLKKEAT